jgi:hypothetical protein
MSIAMSAWVRPSRVLSALAIVMGMVLLTASILLERAADAPLHHALAIACAIASVVVVLFPLRRRKAFRIDVTGTGQIRLADTSCTAATGPIDVSAGDGEVVQLLRGSTFWSSLMVLRLQSDAGHITDLIIFSDSMESHAFRALSTACRWIAASPSRQTAKSADISPRSD